MNDVPRLGAYLALFSEIGLVLFAITILVNAIGRFILYKMTPHGETHG